MYESSVAADQNSPENFYSYVIQDLEHPLNVLVKPVWTLGARDADRIRQHLPEVQEQPSSYPLTVGDQNVLRAALKACEWAPRATR